MADLVKKIRTDAGDLQIDYNALANLPTTDVTLAVSGKAADAKAVGDLLNSMYANFSNPNLLINSDFRSPINQRGAQSYESKTSGKDTYNIDRWHASYGTITTVNDGNITVAGNTGANRYFYQTFERHLSGTFTFSFDIANLQGNISMYYDDNGTGTTINIPTGVTKMTFTATNLKSIGFFFPKTNGISATINWAKLEVGSIATPFVPRLYAEELALCRRYYQNIDLHCLSGLVSDNGSKITFASSVYLRGTPTITIKKAPTSLRVDSVGDVTTTLTYSSVYCNENVCSVTFNSSASLGQRAVAWSIYEFTITADAEIY
jgi:hypothetical protein